MTTGAAVVDKVAAVALETSGAAIANNALAQAGAGIYDIFTDGGARPDAKFIFGGAFATAPTENAVLAVYARPMDIDGANNSDAPETTRPTVFIGVLPVNNVTTMQYIELTAYDVPWRAQYYVHNSGTGQTLSSGWWMSIIPKTISPSP